MRMHRVRSVLTAAGLLAASTTLLVSAPSSAAAQIGITGTVPNRFERTCSLGCSPFIQVNGPFDGRVPSVCVTKYPGPYPPDKVTQRAAGSGPCTGADG